MAAASTTRPGPRLSARSAGTASAATALLIVFVGLLFLYVNPLRSYCHTLQESKAPPGRGRQASRREHRRLEAPQAGPARPRRCVEAEARRLGMVRPGERAFVVRGLPNGKSPARGYAAAMVRDGDQQWREGERRLERRAARGAARPRPRDRADLLELRRRLGSAFTVDELVDALRAGTELGPGRSPCASRPTIPGPGSPRTVVDARVRRATCARPATTPAAAASPPDGALRNVQNRPAARKPSRS